jgi:hypothetical protein
MERRRHIVTERQILRREQVKQRDRKIEAERNVGRQEGQTNRNEHINTENTKTQGGKGKLKETSMLLPGTQSCERNNFITLE